MKLLVLLLLTASLCAVDADRSPDHAALRDILAKATQALNNRDLSGLEQLLARPYTFVLSDQTLITDMAGLRKADEAWFGGAKPKITALKFSPTVDTPAIFLSETVAVASGTSSEEVTLASGERMTLTSRWTTTVLKTPDGWRISQVHAGISPFANPVMDRMGAAIRSAAMWGAVAGALVGAIIGLLIGRKLARTT